MGIKILKDKGYEVDVNPQDKMLDQKQLISYLKKKSYDVVLTLLTDKIDRKVFQAAPTVRMFANYATGFDNIDITEAKKLGITVTNAPAISTSEAVAEHTIAMILAMFTRINEGDRFIRKGKYKGWSAMNLIGSNFAGKTLGLIGAGRIGEKVAFYAKNLGMKIVYTDMKPSDQINKEYNATFFPTPEEVLRYADVVSLHVPLLESTRHLINETRLKLMKPTSFLVNTSRGPVVDEKALEKALKNKVIAGAALDVFEFEPKVVSGLLKLNNTILTPHIASASMEARIEMVQVATGNIIDFLEGRTPKNILTS